MQSAHRLRANIFQLQDLEIRRLLAAASLGANNTLVIVGSGASEVIEVNQLTNGLVAVTGDTDRFTPGSGAGEFNKITIDGVGGNDLITIFGGVTYTAATIRGGSGNDFITGGSGADLIVGDGGIDGASYTGRPATSPLRISLDLTANDGRSTGEGDNVQTEEVFGGSGADTITGSPGDDFLAGGGGADSISGNGGNDEIVGSVGSDRLFGNEGDDALYAKNNDVDTVNGGTGPGTSDFDLAEVDSIDTSGSSATALARLAALQAELLALDDPAALDPTYDGDGLNSGPPLGWEEVTAATIDSQGRTVLVGYALRDNGLENFNYDFVAVRYNADGSFDEEFAGDGEAVIDFTEGEGYADDDFAYGVTTDVDDNIIIVGRSENGESNGSDDFAICRLDNTGAIDTVFGTRRYDIVSEDTEIGGDNDDRAHDVVVQADGKIVVVGTSNFDSESQGGDLAILRLDALGDLDAGFNEGTGMNTFDLGSDQGVAVAIQAAGETDLGIVVGGNTNGDFLLVRFTAAGELDANLNEDTGYSTFSASETSSDILNDIAVHPTTGDVIAVGQSVDFIITLFAIEPVPQSGALGVLAGFFADGTLGDNALHGIDGSDVSFNAVAYDPSTGGFGVAGSTGQDFVVAKFANVNEFAPGFEGLVVTDLSPEEDGSWSDVALGIGISEEGKMTVGGYSSFLDFETESFVLQTSVARYGVGGDPPVSEVEGFLDFDDVQNSNRPRSSAASFYLKSSHLDDNGNAIVNLTNNNDVVVIERVGDLVLLTFNGLSVPYDPDTTNAIIINGGNGNDVITATDDVTIPLIINGGNGTDQLGGGGGDDVIDGGNGNDVVTGGAGNDVLLGGGNGSDNISGNAGLDILIGGNGGDNLNGGDDDDIVIGGTTAHDNNLAALQSLSAEWSSGDPDRISHLTNGGGLNGTNLLRAAPGATVFDDGVRDSMTGGGGNDWAFRRNTGSNSARDLLLDTFEILTNV